MSIYDVSIYDMRIPYVSIEELTCSYRAVEVGPHKSQILLERIVCGGQAEPECIFRCLLSVWYLETPSVRYYAAWAGIPVVNGVVVRPK